MSSNSPAIIGAVEIGTSQITVLVGECTDRGLSIVGRGECQSRGIIKGEVVDYRAASECTHSALEMAEREAGEKIEAVFLAQTGAHLAGFYNEAALNVRAADNMISRNDINTVCELARAKELPGGRIVVHHIQRPFRVDGRIVPNPEHLVGQRLEAGYWTVHALETKLADMIHVISGFNLAVREIVLSSLASGHIVTTAEERQHGVLAIDIGAGTTDFVLYRDGMPHITGVLPVGGTHLTNDLSIGLRLTEGQAEMIKLRYGRADVQARDKAERVWLHGNFSIGDRQFSRVAIEQITAARAAEILEVVRKKLGGAFSPETCSAGVVLTGGTAKLPGFAEAAARVFGVPAHLGEPPGWVAENLRDPHYSTALGVLHYGMQAQTQHHATRRRTGFFKRLFATT